MLIVEGLVTTRNPDGSTNVAPMGPLVEETWERLVLRPFPTATTCGNLLRERRGVFHVSDDCELLARAAVDRWLSPPELAEVPGWPVPRLRDTCRWYAFEVDMVDDRESRIRLECRVAERGAVRDFLGFNRAKHAVLEAAILATRVGLLDAEFLRREFERLRVIVDKTAGPQERRGFAVLEAFVSERTP
jgi:hypothetical protein